MVHHSYQCLLYSELQGTENVKFLVAASGSTLDVFRLESGDLLSTSSLADLDRSSPRPQRFNSGSVPYLDPGPEEAQNEDEKRPFKRRKTSSSINASDSSSAEIVVNNEADCADPFSNAIIKVIATANGRYIVAVSGEDKCLRVLEISTDGTLFQRSKRAMPKRPCAITLIRNDSFILCGDKFGDVYSLPLLGQVYEVDDTKSTVDSTSNGKDAHNGYKPFVPSATHLTVHTQKNRNALKQQQKQIFKRSSKPLVDFSSQLLLGHVSLLTDLAYVSLSSPAFNGREYIITSDRDEHIRVSRGIPQTHIIDGFCLGHTQFVSKMCILGQKAHLLLSGGGDDFLLLWDWQNCEILQRIDLRDIVGSLGQSESLQDRNSPPIVGGQGVKNQDCSTSLALSNIKTLDQGAKGVEIILTFEGLPALFFFYVNQQDRIEYKTHLRTMGNVIDFAILGNDGLLVYSMDTIHKEFSTSLMESGEAELRPSVGAFYFTPASRSWQKSSGIADGLVSSINSRARERPFVEQTNTAKGKSLRELLYGLENLRKRGGVGAEDLDAEEVG